MADMNGTTLVLDNVKYEAFWVPYTLFTIVILTVLIVSFVRYHRRLKMKRKWYREYYTENLQTKRPRIHGIMCNSNELTSSDLSSSLMNQNLMGFISDLPNDSLPGFVRYNLDLNAVGHDDARRDDINKIVIDHWTEHECSKTFESDADIPGSSENNVQDVSTKYEFVEIKLDKMCGSCKQIVSVYLERRGYHPTSNFCNGQSTEQPSGSDRTIKSENKLHNFIQSKKAGETNLCCSDSSNELEFRDFHTLNQTQSIKSVRENVCVNFNHKDPFVKLETLNARSVMIKGKEHLEDHHRVAYKLNRKETDDILFPDDDNSVSLNKDTEQHGCVNHRTKRKSINESGNGKTASKSSGRNKVVLDKSAKHKNPGWTTNDMDKIFSQGRSFNDNGTLKQMLGSKKDNPAFRNGHHGYENMTYEHPKHREIYLTDYSSSSVYDSDSVPSSAYDLDDIPYNTNYIHNVRSRAIKSGLNHRNSCAFDDAIPLSDLDLVGSTDYNSEIAKSSYVLQSANDANTMPDISYNYKSIPDLVINEPNLCQVTGDKTAREISNRRSIPRRDTHALITKLDYPLHQITDRYLHGMKKESKDKESGSENGDIFWLELSTEDTLV